MANPNRAETSTETTSVLARIMDLRRQEMADGATDEDLNVTGRLASDLTDEVWGRPARGWADVVDLAAIAFYWQVKNNDGVMLGLTPEGGGPDEHSAAELITAILSLAKGGDNA